MDFVPFFYAKKSEGADNNLRRLRNDKYILNRFDIKTEYRFRPSEVLRHFDRAKFSVISTERSEWRNLSMKQNINPLP